MLNNLNCVAAMDGVTMPCTHEMTKTKMPNYIILRRFNASVYGKQRSYISQVLRSIAF